MAGLPQLDLLTDFFNKIGHKWTWLSLWRSSGEILDYGC
jgi:hypothetical protein